MFDTKNIEPSHQVIHHIISFDQSQLDQILHLIGTRITPEDARLLDSVSKMVQGIKTKVLAIDTSIPNKG